MRVVGGSVLGALVVLAAGIPTASVWAATAPEPGVHVDPGSPAAKEYALPLSQARQTGTKSSAREGSSRAPFGAGITPPGSGGSRGSSGRAGGRQAGPPVSASRPAGSRSPPTGAGSALPSAVLRAARSQPSSGDGSILTLLGGGVAILVLGGLGGAVLRRGRHSPSAT